MTDFNKKSYLDSFSLSNQKKIYFYSLKKLEQDGHANIAKLPFSIKVLLESLLREYDGREIQKEDIDKVSSWNPDSFDQSEIPFKPARVILQDFTGVPAVVDLASMRDAMVKLGGDPKKINPLIPVDLVIDHSVQIDYFASSAALIKNVDMEFQRNRERYEFLKWGQQSFSNFQVVPPSSGIVHQVNLEYLARGVQTKEVEGQILAYPDSLVGTDSHTTMINGIGIVGWGVGGIEAEAVMLGQPIYMLMPEVIGFKLTGSLSEGATATDFALTATQILRENNVVGKFVEFFGPGMHTMTLPDRATISNMAPEYGATMGFFPMDAESLRYLKNTGRSEELIELIEKYLRAQGLFHDQNTPDPIFNKILELDLSSVKPSISGPKRPQDRINLNDVKPTFQEYLRKPIDQRGFALNDEQLKKTGTYKNNGHAIDLPHGAVAIASITSCTNTSNPSVLIAAGLIAKKAKELGMEVPPFVKTSLAPGSLVVEEYLKQAGLLEYLEAIGFHIVGFGCTTCIGNSGPLPEPVANAIQESDLVAAAVLSGNRNFEGRINPHIKANFLASPPLVIIYALAGTIDIDFATEAVGKDKNGNEVFLKDLWPSSQEIKSLLGVAENPATYAKIYSDIHKQNSHWNGIPVSESELYPWKEESTYIQNPPFFEELSPEQKPIKAIENARALVKVGDSITTDHISPAGSFKADTPAGKFLTSNGVEVKDFNSYGSRRGNDRVMTRGTFANIRLKNQIAPGTEGGFTKFFDADKSEGEVTTIFDASLAYREKNIPLVVIAGKDYGMGSSRDWAAKGTNLLGVKAVIAESYERIHRSNLVYMGVLPLQFEEGKSANDYNLSGNEIFDIFIDDSIQARQTIKVKAKKEDGSLVEFNTICRIDTPIEVEYFRNGGILQTVLLKLLKN